MSSFGDFIALSNVCDTATARIISREVGSLQLFICLLEIMSGMNYCQKWVGLGLGLLTADLSKMFI